MQDYAPAPGAKSSRRPGSATGSWRSGWRARPLPGCSMLSWKTAGRAGPGAGAAAVPGASGPAGRARGPADYVTGEDGIARTRAEKGRSRPLVTKFGQVTVSRIAYRAPGVPTCTRWTRR